MKACLIIFAREPEKGKVKTRLSGYLSESRCLNLYKAFLKDTLGIAGKVKCDEKLIAYESSGAYPPYLLRISSPLQLARQKGKNLGERMHNAFLQAFDAGFSRAAIIGTDAPDLPARYVNRAFSELKKKDLILGPSKDGGYYLVALKRACGLVFKGIKWGSKQVLKDSLKNAKQLKMKTALLPAWSDVDDAASLTGLVSRLRKTQDRDTAKWTRACLRI